MDIYSIENNQQEMTIDLKKYLFLFWQWAWLIIIVTVLAGTAAYFLSRRITPTYQASATALVQVPSVNVSDYSAAITSEYLSRTYSQIMTNTSVMEETISQLRLQMSPQQLAGMITVQEVQNSQLIRLSVVSTNPQLAARIANTVIQVFSSEIQEQQAKRFALSKSSLETRMTDIENQINEFGNQLQNAATDEDIDRIETKIAQYQGIFSTLLNSYEQIRLSEAQSMTSVTLIEPANVPNSPFRPRVLMNTALAGLTGFLLTAGSIFALEAMDDTIKTPDDIKNRLDLPVLGIIDSFPQDDHNGGGLIAVKMPRSPITESFRTLRTNVQFASIDRDLKSMLVTSAEPTEGKTTIAANLAVVFAQSGRKTVIIDADMRRPDVHKKFDISNSEGLTSIFYRKLDNHFNSEDKIVKSPIENLQILSSGKLPPNPSEILASVKMKRLIEKIKAENDILIIDSPPILAVTDAVILSPLVDGVLIVIAPGKTTFTAAKNMIEQLQRSKARILGVVIKFMDGRGKRYARRYGYATRSRYDHYYKSDDQ
jgi:capsular exopolysaccharide synthesis family protein